jgi:hypothetical protein
MVFFSSVQASAPAQATTPTPAAPTTKNQDGAKVGRGARGDATTQSQNGTTTERGPKGNNGTQDQALATALGIDLTKLQAAYTTATDEALKQAVTSGLITQAQADQIKANGGRFEGLGRFANASTIDYNALLAKALGITTDQLQAAKQKAYVAEIDSAVTAGTLTQAQADLMKARYALSNSTKFQSAMKTAYEAALKQAVSDGLITQAQADQILADQKGIGLGGMHGGPEMGGRGGHGGPAQNGTTGRGTKPAAPAAPATGS